MNHLLLLTYLEVLESRNFNRASERMNVTQSTISARIRQLEQDLGVRLFERGRGGAEPTAAGRRFETHCRSLLAAWSMAKRDVDVRSDCPRLRVGVQFSLARSIFPSWAERIRTSVPKLDLYLESNFSEQIQRDILTGDMDLGIIFAPQRLPDLHVTEFGLEHYVMMSTNCKHISELEWESYFRVAYTSYFEQQHNELFPELSDSHTVLGSDELAAEFLMSKGGTAYLPGFSLPLRTDHIQDIAQVEGAPLIPQPLYFIVHNRQRSNPLITRATRLFRDLAVENSIDKID